MAEYYIRSSDGSSSDNGSTWALAKASMGSGTGGATANDLAGDTFYLSSSHAESNATGVTIAFAGTPANPSKCLSVSDAGSPEPPTTVTAGASVTTTGGNSLIITGCAYLNGVTFSAGTGGNAVTLALAGTGSSFTPEFQKYDNCTIRMMVTVTESTPQYLIFGSNGAYSDKYLEFINCKFKLGGSGCFIRVFGTALIDGGRFESGSATPNGGLFTGGTTGNGSNGNLTVRNFDFSALGSSLVLVNSATYESTMTFIDCKMPAGWTGALLASGGATFGPGSRFSMYNCDDGATNYRLWIETYSGSIKSETTLVKTSGASDGTTAISWKCVTNANANEYVGVLKTDDMAIWIDSTGSSKTISVDILHDSATALTDAEIWLEIDYLGSSASPIGTPASDKRATVLTTPANQAASSATWTTTGMTNPNKQALEVTFTPNMKGFLYARVCIAKPSYTVYVDPKPTVS